MFSSMRGLWSRHRRKILISLGAAGCGYLLYRFYDAQNKRIAEFERQFEHPADVDERGRLEMHFEIIQKVCDTKTLPNAMHYLRTRFDEDLDLSYLKEKLRQGKTQTSALSKKEKVELWENLKVLSFVRTVSSLWSMTMLCLYVRILGNVLGRQLYLEIARGSSSLEEGSFSRPGQQDFLASADYLSTFGFSSLIAKMQSATEEVVKDKQLNEPFTMEQLRETILQILNLFMSSDGPSYWISYLVPQNSAEYKQKMVMYSNGLDDPSVFVDVSELEQLIFEAGNVMSSPDFANITEISLKAVVNQLVEDIASSVGATSSTSVPLAKLLPQLGLSLLSEPNCDKFLQVVQNLPEVELFYKLLYANMPQVPP